MRHRDAAVRLAVCSLASLLSCVGPDQNCEPPLSEVVVPAAAASYPLFWTTPGRTRLRLVASDTPYQVSSRAIEVLTNVLADQAGITVTAEAGGDSGLAATGILSADAAVRAGCGLAVAGTDPVAVVIAVGDTDEPGATYGFIRGCPGASSRSVVVMHHDPIAGAAFGPISGEVVEAATLLHEVGHWLGVPARDFHRSAVDGEHCTHGQCVMFKGSRLNECAIMANLFTGLPLYFCRDCADELAEMRQRREGTPSPGG